MRATADGKVTDEGKTLAEWVPAIAADLVREFDPLRIVLFGSVARGDDGPDSDVDLVVVFDRLPAPRKHDAAAQVRGAIAALVPVDGLVVDRDGLAEPGDLRGVLRVAQREGKVVGAQSG